MNLPATLDTEVRQFARASRAPNTLRSYASDTRIFLRWCQAHGYDAASPEVIKGFLADQAHTCGATTLKRRLSGIRHLYKAKGLPSPIDDSVYQVLAGIQRTLGTAARPRTPLVADAIKQIIDEIDRGISDAKGNNQCRIYDSRINLGLQGQRTHRQDLALRDRALVLLGFCGALRRSELATLEVADVSETADGLLLTIRRSKGDQTGEGQQIAIAPASQARYDAALALKAWLAASGRTAGRIFNLSPYGISEIVKRRAAAAGFIADIAAHSLRSGALTTAAQNGASLFKMLELSRHKDIQTLKRYVHATELFKDHALRGTL